MMQLDCAARFVKRAITVLVAAAILSALLPLTDSALADGNAPRIACAYARGAVVTVEMETGFIAADCVFTSTATCPNADSPDWTPVNAAVFSIFKTDGDYTLFVRDESGAVSEPYAISVRSGFHYVIQAEGLTALSRSLTDVLAENDLSVDAFNAAIAADVASAGMYTRCGVVTAAVSLVSHMSELGASVVYQGHGAYQAEEDWGINPDWGARLKNPTSDANGTYYYEGMQCVAAIVWAYKQAGVNLANDKAGAQIGTCGEAASSGDNIIAYDSARSGDIVQSGGHFLMIVDRLDTDGDGAEDSYLTYEMNAPHLAFLILSFRQIRYRTFFDMSAVFANEGRARAKSRFWEDTFFIPETAMPAYLFAAAAESGEANALDRLLRGLGLNG